jgi:hypothetical protein
MLQVQRAVIGPVIAGGCVAHLQHVDAIVVRKVWLV